MNNMTSGYTLDIYESPIIDVHTVHVEGVLCASGVHDPLTEDDEWADLLN